MRGHGGVGCPRSGFLNLTSVFGQVAGFSGDTLAGVDVKLKASLLGAALLLSACSGSNEPYPAELIDNFMAGCREAGSTTAYCACAIDHIQGELSVDEFVKEEARMELGSRSDRLIDVMADALIRCR